MWDNYHDHELYTVWPVLELRNSSQTDYCWPEIGHQVKLGSFHGCDKILLGFNQTD